MVKSNKLFTEYITSLKKDELNKIIDTYNTYASIYNENKLKVSKNNNAINLINDNIDNYLKYVLSIINLEERTELLKGTYSKDLKDYLNNCYLLDSDNNIFDDIKKSINKLLKDKEVINKIKKWDNIITIINGLIVAYGVVHIKYVKDTLSEYADFEEVKELLKLRKFNYTMDSKKIVSNLLTNKKRIEKYYNDDSYKEFSVDELKSLGTNKYHNNIKEYKKLMGLLKNYYIFKRKDIKYINENVIIPYLYTSINEEDNAKVELDKRLNELFEFRKDDLKDKLCKQIDGLRYNFPLWEYRGFSKKEVE